VTTAAGAVEVVAPWINDKRVDADTAQRVRFRSVTLSPWCWKSPKVVEVLPLLYLHGLPVLAVQMKPSRPVVDRTAEAP